MEFKRQPKKTQKSSPHAPKNHLSPTVSHVLSGRSRPTTQPTQRVESSSLFATLPSKKTFLTLGFLVLFGVLLYSLFRINYHTTEEKNQNTSQQATEQLDLATSDPPFTATLPAGKSIESLGGWQRVSPTKNDPTYAYIDKIDTTPITVSQQSLPESFRSNTDSHVAELAKKFSATSQIKVDSTKVYIGTSAKGPQSVIFSTKSLLILIKSQQTINDAAWTSYIRSLL